MVADLTDDGDEGIDLRTGAPQPDYGAWRERMRSKSARNRELIAPPEAESPRRGPSYWDPEALFRDSEALEVGEVGHLAVLDLRDTATSDEILQAYRSLAKQHHPDRFVEADASTRQYHDDCMRAVNEAYAALRAAQRV